MKLRTLALGVVACGLAAFARQLAIEVAEPASLPLPVVPVRDARILNEVARIVRVDHAERRIEPVEEDEIVFDVDEKPTVEDRREDRLAELEAGLDPSRGIIHGQVRDTKTGETLAGVTITVSVGGNFFQTAISNEDGFYDLEDLEPGEYLATFYYLENTVEHPGVTVVASKLVSLFQTIDTSTRPRDPVIVTIDETTIDELGISFSGSRTFEIPYQVEGLHGDTAGVSFSSNCGLENTYIVED